VCLPTNLHGRYRQNRKALQDNTDFHKASYGTHESYLVPRELGFQKLFGGRRADAVARQILTGPGKVGASTGRLQLPNQPASRFLSWRRSTWKPLYRRPVSTRAMNNTPIRPMDPPPHDLVRRQHDACCTARRVVW